MANHPTPPPVSRGDLHILRPDPRWFLTRGIAFGIVLPLALTALGAGRFGLLFTLGAAVVWIIFRNSSLTLDRNGFTYNSGIRRIAHQWVDVERFGVVEQRVYGFIPVSHYLGWNYSPAYRHYKRLAIPRTLARWAGTTDAMFKPMGFNVKELVRVLNQHLEQARADRSCASVP